MTETRLAELKAELAAAQHAMQSGVAATLSIHGDLSASGKSLRVGVNSALVEVGALAELLIDKGVFTEEEYLVSLVKAMRDEVTRYETSLSEHHHVTIKLH